jgi:thioredoxin 1
VFRADFDKDKDLLKEMKVAKQGTLIAFKGKSEKTRTVGDTDEAAIRKVFEAAL